MNFYSFIHFIFILEFLNFSIVVKHWNVAMALTYDYFQHRIMCKTVDTQYFYMYIIDDNYIYEF